MSVVAFVAGVVVVVLTVAGVIDTLILPRPPAGLGRIALFVVRAVHWFFDVLTRLARRYETRDRILALVAPVALIVQLLSWAAAFSLGFALMMVGTTHSLGWAIEQSVTALFTVGAIHPGGQEAISLDIVAGATWVVVVALQIAYLPSLYATFAQREGSVTLLETRGGKPAWGPELLVRFRFAGIEHLLAEFYREWEVWSAAVAESHTTYPVLMYFRSPDPWSNWASGLLAVLDAAALHMAIAPNTYPSEARVLLHTGFTSINRAARSLGWEIPEDPGPNPTLELTFEEFSFAVDILRRYDVAVERSAEEAWPDFRGWRANYELAAYRLADYLTAPPVPWSGTRHGVRADDVEVRHAPHQLLDRSTGGLAPGDHSARGTPE